MKCILDTHTFMWLDSDSAKLSISAKAAIADPANEVMLSLVSVWEIVIKHSLGKLPLRGKIEEIVAEQLSTNVRLLAIRLEHVLAVQGLPDTHRDPFDRLLAAQAVAEDAVLVTADPIFAQYPVRIVW